MVYKEDGDGLAIAYFNLSRNNGAINVQKSLLTTNETYFEVIIQVVFEVIFPTSSITNQLQIILY